MEKFRCGRCEKEVVFKDAEELLASGFCNSALCVDCEQAELGKILEEESFIDRCIRVQKDFKELYSVGLTGVSSSDIHLNSEKFKELFGVGPDVERRDIGGYIRVSKKYKDVEILALFKFPVNINDIEL